MGHVRLTSLALLFALAACAGGGALPGISGGVSGESMQASREEAQRRVPVALHVVIGRAHKRHRIGRSPKFVSPGTNGLAVAVYPHGAAHTAANLVTAAVVDVSSGSAACGGHVGFPRTCTASVKLAPTSAGQGYDVVVDTYDASPTASGSLAGAHLLGAGALSNAAVALGKANDLVVYVSGVIASLTGLPAGVSLPGDGNPHTLGIVIDPEDFGNHAITAGANDPFANPISVTLKETGGSGNMQLSLNGGTPGSQVTVSHSSDSVQVIYNGVGQTFYGATVTLTAPAVSGFGGATESMNVSPMVLLASGSAAHYAIPPYLVLNGNGDFATIYETELNPPAGATYSATPSHCSSIVDTTAVKPLYFGIPGFIAFARPTASQNGCTIAVSDGMSTVTLLVINQYTGSLGSPKITEFGTPALMASPTGITVGPDGAMWFYENIAGVGGRIARIDATGTSPTLTDYPLPTAQGPVYPGGIAVGPDDNFWFTGYGEGSQLGNVSTGGTGTVWANTASTDPKNIVQGSDGAMWFTEWGAAGNQIGRITTNGTVTVSGTIGAGSLKLSGITLGSDGNAWFTECGAGIIGKITPNMQVTQMVLASGSQPVSITSGPDGALWFTDQGKNAIERIPTSATPADLQLSKYTGATGSHPSGITTGPDGALWFTECSDPTSGPHNGLSVVGRLDANTHVISEYAMPYANLRPYDIAPGPDGAIWFGEQGGDSIDRIAIGSSAAVRQRDPRVEFAHRKRT
jgi:virginiamycin B lyase